MKLFELADEFRMTSANAAAMCAQLGIRAGAAGDEVSPADAERFRAAARAAAAPVMPPPVTPPMPPSVTLPIPGIEDATPGWASPTSPFAPPATPGSAFQAPQPAAPGASPWASGVSPDDLARLSDARRRANNAIAQGFGLMALTVVITIAMIAFVPGGFFIISIGTFIGGIRRISAGTKMRARVRQAEQQLGVRRS